MTSSSTSRWASSGSPHPATLPGSVYLSAHSGGGITISALSKHPFHKYRFGGIFAFESFHAFDLAKWRGLARITSARTWPSCSGCEPTATTSTTSPPPRRRSCATGVSTGRIRWLRRLRRPGPTLRTAILDWFANHHRELITATGGKPEILDLLWRNYQANYASEGHMAALSKDNHFESALESLVARARRRPRRSAQASDPPSRRPAQAEAKARRHRPTARYRTSRPKAPKAQGPQATAAHVHHKQRCRGRAQGRAAPPSAANPPPPRAATSAATSTPHRRRPAEAVQVRQMGSHRRPDRGDQEGQGTPALGVRRAFAVPQ